MSAVLANYDQCLRQKRTRDVKAWAGVIMLVLMILVDLSNVEVRDPLRGDRCDVPFALVVA